ncbi:glutaredoxin family protein [Candidatus Accumulibacter cognatus]|uniref:Glutaredoxin-like protein, YruB-family n=1 Tax=Candidatus Accumulibacter cognatus TaxID=2954383 RepID=A0A080M9U0_9PROT|nr:glutaredoxin family protein [Candidatus Accumulibacter cognatus]KFB77220.1 MAG: glutaredoxin-like protein, YruB-family [Candidatus Accumulibacter cognatus]
MPTTARRLGRATAIVLLIAGTASAQTTYRWIDPKSGGTIISDLPPPPGARQVMKYSSTTGVDEQQLPYAVRQASEKFPVILYTSTGCVTCKQARGLLNGRGIPFTEKMLTSEEEIAELGRQLGGESLLPSISVGRQSARGFAPTTWNELLDAAGYPANNPQRIKPSSGAAAE